MSTKALIKCVGTEVVLYRHSDGYPNGEHGVLDFLEPFVLEFKANRGNDPAYFMARLSQTMCNKYDAAMKNDPNWKFMGHGLYVGERIDAAYTYEVDLSTGEITWET